MFGFQFNFDLIRKYTLTFGTLFNNIRITRKDENDNTVNDFKVPIAYAAKEVTIQRVREDPDLNRPFAITLPRMSFELENITFDPERKLGSLKKIFTTNPDTNKLDFIYNPVPYNLNYNLYIYSKAEEDANKIVERILPFFIPDFTPTIELVTRNDIPIIKADVPIVLGSITHEDRYEGAFENKRVVIWTMQFVVKGYFYGPIRTGAVIKFVEGNLKNLETLSQFEQVKVQPGLTANGEPTSNIENSVDPSLIEKEDNWGVIVQILGANNENI